MKSRLTITMVLAFGILLSCSGSSLAISGVAGGGSAGSAQYPQEVTPTGEQGEVLSGPGVSGPSQPSQPSQPTRQVTAGGGPSGLPFTGWAVLPLILVGVGLLGGGALLRRNAATRPA